jgi:pilus assembly protein CpaB
MFESRKAQIALLGVAVLTCVGAIFFLKMGASRRTPAPIVQAARPSEEQVLVANRDLPAGTAVADSDVSWVQWPQSSLPAGIFRKSENPAAKEELRSSVVRLPIFRGEPLRRERLNKGSAMASILSPGRRAVAIDVTPQGANAAGGFILPNDRVDVIRTFRDQARTRERGMDVFGTEPLVANVRVLAMGQTLETKNGETVVAGVTATLELNPHQAELIILGQRTGQLALALRASADAPASDENLQAPSEGDGRRLANAFGVLHGRLTLPRDGQSAPHPGNISSNDALNERPTVNGRAAPTILVNEVVRPEP